MLAVTVLIFILAVKKPVGLLDVPKQQPAFTGVVRSLTFQARLVIVGVHLDGLGAKVVLIDGVSQVVDVKGHNRGIGPNLTKRIMEACMARRIVA